MVKQLRKPKKKPSKEFFWSLWGYTRKQFQNWGKQGGNGQPVKYSSNAEKQKAYRRRKATSEFYQLNQGIFNLATGRIKKYANAAERQRAYRLRKKLAKG